MLRGGEHWVPIRTLRNAHRKPGIHIGLTTINETLYDRLLDSSQDAATRQRDPESEEDRERRLRQSPI